MPKLGDRATPAEINAAGRLLKIIASLLYKRCEYPKIAGIKKAEIT